MRPSCVHLGCTPAVHLSVHGLSQPRAPVVAPVHRRAFIAHISRGASTSSARDARRALCSRALAPTLTLTHILTLTLRSIAFLHREYEVHLFFWELVESRCTRTEHVTLR